MASYTFKLKENTDLCHFNLSSEKDFGVQCVILRDCNSQQDYTSQHANVVKALFEGRAKTLKDVAFLHVASPGKAFEKFDQEKYKLVLTGNAYLKLLEFFQSDWSLLQRRLDLDFQSIKTKKDWILMISSFKFKGPADIVYRLPLDTSNTLCLELVVTKRGDNGKTNICLVYTDETLGILHLPPPTMVNLAKDLEFVKSHYDYKDGPSPKRGRQ